MCIVFQTGMEHIFLQNLFQYISDKIAVILRSPKRKAEIKEPIKESIRDRLARSQKRADELNARRRAEHGAFPRQRQQDIELF